MSRSRNDRSPSDRILTEDSLRNSADLIRHPRSVQADRSPCTHQLNIILQANAEVYEDEE